MPVIDASVYVAIINVKEQDHTQSWAWFEQSKMAGETIYAPTIMLAEVAAAISRGSKDPVLAHQVVQQLEQTNVIELVPVTRTMAAQAASIAADHRIRGCDSVYVALARQLSTSLVTLDHKQLERGSAVVATCEPRA
jgi:predicted nucleic acid-binding protein